MRCRFSALHCAATYGNFDVVESLLRARADGDQRDNDGRTPLDCARVFANDEASFLLAAVRRHAVLY
jgi:ankyrin repeat protein